MAVRKLAMFSFSFALGAAAYIWLFSSLSLWIPAVCPAIVLVIGIFLSGDRGKRLRILALGALVGLFWTWGYEQYRILPLRAYEGEDQRIRVSVLDYPEEADYGCTVTAKLGTGKIRLYLDCEKDVLGPGDLLTVTADIVSTAQDKSNLYFQSRDISLLGFGRGSPHIQKAEQLPLRAYPLKAAQALRDCIREIFPEDTAPFALALLTGDKGELSFQQQNDLSISGISHVVAVSGMHISLLVALVLWLCGSRKKLAAFVCLFVMLFFAAMLGFVPSATRAVIMHSLLIFAPLLQRENDSLTSLGGAMLLILLIQPWAIANVSFQLSFSAMLGIFFAAPWMYQQFAKRLRLEELREKKSPFHSAVYRLSVILATSFASILATAPLCAYYFETVSLVAPLTNVLTLPVISFSFPVCVLAGILGFLWQPLGAAVGWLISWAIRYVQWIAGLMAKIPYAAVYTTNQYVVFWLVTAYVLFGIYLWKRHSCRLRELGLALCLTLVATVLVSGLEPAEMTLSAMDVGQGQCILLRSGGKTALIDCGGEEGDPEGETVARHLLMLGEDQVDAVILTHFDHDHICGLPQLMKRLEVGAVYLPDIQQGDETRALVLEAVEQEGAELHFVRLPECLPFGSGEIRLYPPTAPEEDNASLSALMSFDEYDILVTGDMAAFQERKLLEEYAFPEIEVLFAGHHGSKFSTSRELLEATTPETVIICVGENTYGHPSEEVLERISAVGAQVYRTDWHGIITIKR